MAPSSRHPTARAVRFAWATVVSFAAISLVAPGLVGQAPPVYQATYLGPGSHVAAMNDAGTVVCRGSIGVIPRAFVAGPTTPATYLPLPLGFLSSTPTDINQAGVITGNISPYQTTAFSAQPAVWHPDGAGGYLVTLLATLPGDDRGTADALNDVGDILGTSSFTSTKRTVLFTGTGTVELPGMGARPAVSVNDQRVYVTPDAELVQLNTLMVQSLGVPAGSDAATAAVVNELGQVAGALVQSGCGSVPAVHTPGAGWQPLGSCGAADTCFDMNDAGDVLLKIGGEPHVLLAGLGSWRVEDLIAENGGHWAVGGAAGIAMNDVGQLAVIASNATTAQSGVILLTPEPGVVCQEDLGSSGPGSLALSLCGGDLSSGTTADLLLTGGLPSGVAWVFLGAVQGNYPFAGGTLVPVPWVTIRWLTLDASGDAQVLGIPGGGPFSVVLQAVVPDPGLPLGSALSNALRADFLP